MVGNCSVAFQKHQTHRPFFSPSPTSQLFFVKNWRIYRFKESIPRQLRLFWGSWKKVQCLLPFKSFSKSIIDMQPRASPCPPDYLVVTQSQLIQSLSHHFLSQIVLFSVSGTSSPLPQLSKCPRGHFIQCPPMTTNIQSIMNQLDFPSHYLLIPCLGIHTSSLFYSNCCGRFFPCLPAMNPQPIHHHGSQWDPSQIKRLMNTVCLLETCEWLPHWVQDRVHISFPASVWPPVPFISSHLHFESLSGGCLPVSLSLGLVHEPHDTQCFPQHST